MRSRLASILLIIVCAPAVAEPLYWWKQPDERGGWQVRLINAAADRCPSGTTVLSEPDRRFPVRVCVAPLRRPLSIGGLGRVTPPGYVDRAVILGDAGCDSEDQDCSNPSQWPFAQIAASIEKLDADLLVHVGDFLYRGTCSEPVQEPHCADDWAEWDADFFTPARPLLRGATWVFSRGNHEDCQRGGVGFERLLGNGSSICELPRTPYLARLPNLDLLLLDTSYAPPYEIAESSANKLDRYTRYIDRLGALSDREAWLVMHVPIWAFTNPTVDAGERYGSTVLQQAVRDSRPGQLPPNVIFLLTGHIHVWEVISWSGSTARPPILLAGNGGGGLSAPLLRPSDGQLDGLPAQAWGTNTEYGFMIADEVKQADGRRGWRVKPIRAPWSENDGYVCTFIGRSGGCEPPAPVIPPVPQEQ
jgi:hypothetical protein